MSDFLTASDAPLSFTLGGRNIVLPILTNTEIRTLCAKIRGWHVAAAKQIAEEMKFGQLESGAFVHKYMTAPVKPQDAYAYISSIEGCDEAIDLSFELGKVDPIDRAAIKKLSTLTRQDIAVDVSGMVTRRAPMVKPDASKLPKLDAPGLGDANAPVPQPSIGLGDTPEKLPVSSEGLGTALPL